MPSRLVSELISDAVGLWRCTNNVEITLEANPTSVETQKLLEFQGAGVNRISMGVQALNDMDLRKLGRMHSAEDALRAMDKARSAFDRVSIDLIYARQDQTLDDWEAELSRALSFGLDHLSLYQLTIEPGTVFSKRHRSGRLLGLPTEDMSADMWDITQDLTLQAMMPAYEVSNHARAGAESQHNILYWTGGDWGGIGPGAHGRLTLDGERWATETHLLPEKWLSAVESTATGESERRRLTADDIVDETILMGLRMIDGVDLAQVKWKPDPNAITELVDMGMLRIKQDRMTVTNQGRPLLNAVIERLLV